jgi:hypothetical protein
MSIRATRLINMTPFGSESSARLPRMQNFDRRATMCAIPQSFQLRLRLGTTSRDLASFRRIQRRYETEAEGILNARIAREA